MRTSMLITGFILLLTLLIGIGCGDDDKKITNPEYTIPSNLVGTWWYHSGTQDGVPIGSFAEISMTDTSQAGSVTFHSNDTWNSAETYNSQVVFTRSGTLWVKSDTLKIIMKITNGIPEPTIDTSSGIWNITGDTLILMNEIDLGSDTFTVVIKYLPE
jgi:hypothetical protein